MKENKTKYVILGILNHEDCSGYDIKNRIDVALSQFFSAGFGQIYPTLKQLVEEGMIINTESSSKNGPERKVYQITKTGKIELDNWLKIPVEKEDVRFEILLKLFFAGNLNKEDILSHIEYFEKRNRLKLEKLQKMASELEGIMEESVDHKNYYLTALFGIRVHEAYLRWAEEAKILV
ncbi:PadR family transcriptional regulator [Eubacteriaceae bacterium ES2]|nr:PadR family transcriptional regulator [Eubacteriaceae bacterium ES2]